MRQLPTVQPMFMDRIFNLMCEAKPGDKCSTKVRCELHFRVFSSSRIHRSGGWTCVVTVNRRQRRSQRSENAYCAFGSHFGDQCACNCQMVKKVGEDWIAAGAEKPEREQANDNMNSHDCSMNGIGLQEETDSNDDRSDP